jgi:hypothetical protein
MENEYLKRKDYLLAYAQDPENKNKRMNAIKRYQEKNRQQLFCACCNISCVSNHAYLKHLETNKHNKNSEKNM